MERGHAVTVLARGSRADKETCCRPETRSRPGRSGEAIGRRAAGIARAAMTRSSSPPARTIAPSPSRRPTSSSTRPTCAQSVRLFTARHGRPRQARRAARLLFRLFRPHLAELQLERASPTSAAGASRSARRSKRRCPTWS